MFKSQAASYLANGEWLHSCGSFSCCLTCLPFTAESVLHAKDSENAPLSSLDNTNNINNTKPSLSRQNADVISPQHHVEITKNKDNVTRSSDNKNSKRGLSRHNAFYFVDGYKMQFVDDKFDPNAILAKLDKQYSYLDFLQYLEALQSLNLNFLESVNTFEPHFYQMRIGMSEEAAELFRQSISKEFAKALLEHERAKARRRGEPAENTVPVHFC
jgi:hypothetical protein